MNKPFHIVLISILYLFTGVLIYAGIGTAVSMKYEVDEGYTFLDMRKSLSPAEKQIQLKELDAKSKRLDTTYILLNLGALATFLGATALVFYRRKLISVPAKNQ